jgi:hypothetical protein
MKINGRKLEGKHIEEVYFPRGEDGANGEIMRIQAVSDFTKFNELVPEPKPPMITKPGQGTVAKLDDPVYQKNMEAYNRKRLSYFVIEGLLATDGVEWEKVNVNDPETWEKYEEDLQDYGLTQMEVGQVLQAVMRVNTLDEDHIKAARKRFLASQQQQG